MLQPPSPQNGVDDGEDPGFGLEEHRILQKVRDKASAIGRLPRGRTKLSLKRRQRTGNSRPSFKNNDQNHRQVTPAIPSIEHPLPAPVSTNQRQNQPKRHERHTGKVNRDREVSKNSIQHLSRPFTSKEAMLNQAICHRSKTPEAITHGIDDAAAVTESKVGDIPVVFLGLRDDRNTIDGSSEVTIGNFPVEIQRSSLVRRDRNAESRPRRA